MFADAPSELPGLRAMVHWNPLRWSPSQSVERCILDLHRQTPERPVYLKVPPGAGSSMQRFDSARKAIQHVTGFQDTHDGTTTPELPLRILRGKSHLGSLYSSVAFTVWRCMPCKFQNSFSLLHVGVYIGHGYLTWAQT